MKRALAIVLFLFAPFAAAQTADDITFARTFLLRNVSGTAANPGPLPHHAILTTRGDWTTYVEGAAFLTRVTQSGPKVAANETFSTNWFGAAAQRTAGNRGLILFRVRGSLEPLTIKKNGYPQLLQASGDAIDRMRPANLLGEAAVHGAWRLGSASFAHLYLAPVGDPALGPVPVAPRASAEDFAEAPFTYRIQETLHEATRVATGGFATRFVSLEGSVFHESHPRPRYTSIDDGAIDSWSGRVTVNPTPNLAVQYSRASLGDAKLPATSVSVTFGTEKLASSAMWTRREQTLNAPLNAFAFELLLRSRIFSFMGRAESTNDIFGQGPKRTDVTLGLLADLIRARTHRIGAGLNIDYHTNSKLYASQYGHKPQSAYFFLRARTEAARR